MRTVFLGEELGQVVWRVFPPWGCTLLLQYHLHVPGPQMSNTTVTVRAATTKGPLEVHVPQAAVKVHAVAEAQEIMRWK